MDDSFTLEKDGHVLAHLSGASALGQFTAYKTMEVTDEGRRRGYFNLKMGEYVHTPHSKMQGGTRVQLPLRKGILVRILVGQTLTGQKKKASKQNNVLCLSLVEKCSKYDDAICDPLGLYDLSKPWKYDHDGGWIDDYDPFEEVVEDPLQKWEQSYCFVVTSARCTSPRDWIWGEQPDLTADGRQYNEKEQWYRANRSRLKRHYFDLFGVDDPFWYTRQLPVADGQLLDFMASALADYAVPSVTTAVGQARRAMVATKHTTSARCVLRSLCEAIRNRTPHIFAACFSCVLLTGCPFASNVMAGRERCELHLQHSQPSSPDQQSNPGQPSRRVRSVPEPHSKHTQCVIQRVIHVRLCNAVTHRYTRKKECVIRVTHSYTRSSV